MVTLLGTIERVQDGQLLFRVAPDKADAPAIGFPVASAGSPPVFWIKRAQCHVREARKRGELDEIRLAPELASLKAQAIIHAGC